MKKIQYKIEQWWKSIYKIDDLGKFICGGSIILFLLASFSGSVLLKYFAIVSGCSFLYRYCSRQHWSRIRENNWYLKYKKLWELKFESRKTHKIFLCKSCGKFVRVPKGKGKIEVTCISCGEKTVKRT